tara:strand:- start:129 stop:1640 length:1512 start_codon:yes stop_codon:yes gene_type:complete
MTHLNDISKIYLEAVAKKKKDDSYLETDFKKRQANNEKARKDLMKGPQMKNPHFEEVEVEEGVLDNPEHAKNFKANADELAKKLRDRNKKKMKEALDPVGQEDGDVDNDGKKNTKSDKYLIKRRKAIARAMKEQEEKIDGSNLKKLSDKAMKRVDADVDGDVDKDDPKEKGMGEYIPSADGKKKIKPMVQKEGFSDWRSELFEILDSIEGDKQVKEKKIKNKVKINPPLGESIEEIGGTLVEMIELDDVESVYEELIQEGYDVCDIEDAVEYALVEVSDRYYDSAVKASKQAAAKKNREELKKKALGRLKFMKRKAGEAVSSVKKKVGMASAKAQVAAYNKGREVAQTAGDKAKRAKAAVKDAPKKAKSGLKSAIKKVAQKVVDRMSEEAEQDPKEKQMLMKKKQMMMKQQILDKQRIQAQMQGKLPSGHRVEQKEEMSVKDQMKISREAAKNRKPFDPEARQKQRAAQMRNAAKKAKKDTRTDAEKMADATGPRRGSNYRGD